MKTYIAASIIALASSTAVSGPFDFERQIGTPALFPTLTSESSAVMSTSIVGPTSFAYERAIGTPELFPSVGAEVAEVGQVDAEKPLERGQFSAMETGVILDPSIRFSVEQ